MLNIYKVKLSKRAMLLSNNDLSQKFKVGNATYLKKKTKHSFHYKQFLKNILSIQLLRTLAFHKFLKPTLTPESDGLQGIGVDEMLQ